MTAFETILNQWCEKQGFFEPIDEYRFNLNRKWRFDFCWPEDMVAMEIEGGTWLKAGGGRHNQPASFERDCEKYNAATLQGWRVLRYTTKQINAMVWVADLCQLLKKVKYAKKN